MYRSVVAGTVADVAPGTLISVGGVTTFDVTAAPACPAGHVCAHAAAEVAPAADNVPAGHVTQFGPSHGALVRSTP